VNELVLEADLEVTLEKTVRDAYFVTSTGTNGTNQTEKRWRSSTTTVTESVTVADRLDVELYDLSATLYRTTYPDGSSGIAVFQTRPWQGYSLDKHESTSVRGVWRFYTARDTDWERLTKATGDGHARIESAALPVYVHAYPSKLGPRAEPIRTGPEITNVWGTTQQTPASTIGENVNVEVVTEGYDASYGVAVRDDAFSREEFTVRGIVRGTTATIETPAEESSRHVHASELSIEVIAQNESGTTLRLELTDAETGTPIQLASMDDSRYAPLVEDSRSGYVTVADRRVETNESGMAIVRIDQPGLYTARYHPGSWLSHDPAYSPDSASTRWHPLKTTSGWVSLITTIIQWFLPFGVAWLAGRQLGRIFSWEVS
jgi:hypothetical protein